MGTGIEPLIMAASVGSKLIGGAAGGGGGGAPAGGGVNPLSAGLLGMAPPPPEKNELFHDSAEQEAMLGNLRKQTERDVPKPFDTPATPWTTETVQGTSPNPSNSNVGLLSAQVQKPQEAPPQQAQAAAPAPTRIDLGGENVSRGMLFDTAAPSAPGSQASGSSFGDGTSWLKGVSDKLKGVPTNPLAQTSLGLLQSGYDGSNPWANISGNLNRIPGMEIANAQNMRAQSESDRKKAEDADAAAKMAQLLMLMKGGEQEGQGGGQRSMARTQGQASVVR